MVHVDVSGNGSFPFLYSLAVFFSVAYRENVGRKLLIFSCLVFTGMLFLFLIDLLQHLFVQRIGPAVESNSPVFQADDAT